jgi:hypothetical protein
MCIVLPLNGSRNSAAAAARRIAAESHDRSLDASPHTAALHTRHDTTRHQRATASTYTRNTRQASQIVTPPVCVMSLLKPGKSLLGASRPTAKITSAAAPPKSTKPPATPAKKKKTIVASDDEGAGEDDDGVQKRQSPRGRHAQLSSRLPHGAQSIVADVTHRRVAPNCSSRVQARVSRMMMMMMVMRVMTPRVTTRRMTRRRMKRPRRNRSRRSQVPYCNHAHDTRLVKRGTCQLTSTHLVVVCPRALVSFVPAGKKTSAAGVVGGKKSSSSLLSSSVLTKIGSGVVGSKKVTTSKSTGVTPSKASSSKSTGGTKSSASSGGKKAPKKSKGAQTDTTHAREQPLVIDIVRGWLVALETDCTASDQDASLTIVAPSSTGVRVCPACG